MGSFDVGRRSCVIRCVLLLNYHAIRAVQRGKYYSDQRGANGRLRTLILRVRLLRFMVVD